MLLIFIKYVEIKKCVQIKQSKKKMSSFVNILLYIE